jgi:ferredoxin
MTVGPADATGGIGPEGGPDRLGSPGSPPAGPSRSANRSNPVQITVDHDRCFGYARCVDTAPDTFSLDENGLSVPRESSDDEQTIRAAAWACPVQAIETDAGPH